MNKRKSFTWDTKTKRAAKKVKKILEIERGDTQGITEKNCKSFKPLMSFIQFCIERPELRFWQALVAWKKVDKIYIQRYDKKVDDEVLEDTFYLKGK